MRNKIALSGVALAVILLATAPANAFTLSVGGDGALFSVNESSESSSSGGVGVDVGVGGSTDSGLNVDASLDADLQVDGDASLGLFGGQKKLLTTGGDNLVTVDTSPDSDALVTLFGGPEIGSAGVDIGLGSGAADGVAVSLFGGSRMGGGEMKDDATSGGTEGAAFASLFGTGKDNSGDAGSIGPSEDRMSSAFGTSKSDPGGTGVDSMQSGSIASNGPGAGNGVASAGAGGRPGGSTLAPAPAMPATIAPRVMARVAATTGAQQAKGSCFSPDDQQIANLRARATYDGSVTASWKSAADISIVPINLCPEARARLAAAIKADANIEYLQAAVAADARLNASLDPSYDPEDVLAVDKAGDELTVYVY